MPRKPQALSSAFNTAKPVNETSNKIQSPWFPFTYAASDDTSNSSPAVKVSASSNYNVGSEDASASLPLSNEGQSSSSVFPCNDDSLQPNVSAQKRKSPDVLQLREYNEACATRNVKPKLDHPASNLAAASMVSQPQKNTATYDQQLSIDAYFQQSKQRQQKRKKPVVEQQCTQAQATTGRNLRRRLESAGVHGIQSTVDKGLHISETASTQPPYYANTVTHPHASQRHPATPMSKSEKGSDISQQPCTPANLALFSHHSSEQHQTTSLNHMDHAPSYLQSQDTQPALQHTQGWSDKPISVMPNAETHCQLSLSEPSENRPQKRLRG